MDSLVSTDWLAANLGQSALSVVDSSWHMPASGRDGADEFRAAHIPGARFLDIDAVSDRASAVPHALPTAEAFGDAMEQLGIGRDDRIVVYDNSPLRTAARGWFMLRHFGARQVAILDGGFEKWQAEGRPVESGELSAGAAHFAPSERSDVVAKAALLAGAPHPILYDRRIDGIKHVLIAKGLGQEVDGTGLHAAHGHWDIAVAGDEHHGDADFQLGEALLEIESAGARQAHVEHKA